MRYSTAVLSLLFLGMTLTSCGPAPSMEEGVWRLSGVTVNDGGNVVPIENPGDARLMLHGGQYSQVWMQAGRMYSSPPTNLEKIDAYDSFDASAGTYTFQNGTLTLMPEIARDPASAGQSTSTAVTINGDTMTRTAERVNPTDASRKIQWTSTYTRIK